MSLLDTNYAVDRTSKIKCVDMVTTNESGCGAGEDGSGGGSAAGQPWAGILVRSAADHRLIVDTPGTAKGAQSNAPGTKPPPV